MASKKTLNAKNLTALGAERLADLLLEVTKGNAAAKRRLRLELAGEESAQDVAREIQKRLATINRSRSFIDWRGRNALAADLEMLRRSIVEQVGRADAETAFDLIWRFVALSNGIYERCDDSTGKIQDIFHTACDDLAELAKTARLDALGLADRLSDALPGDEYGHYPKLIAGLAPVLGTEGLDHLKSRILADQMNHSRNYVFRAALEQIADAQGDVDGFIDQQGKAGRRVPQIAAEIAHRLLDAGRPEEAWDAINAPDREQERWLPYEWEAARIAVLGALGRTDDAQTFRWACFERTLNADHLRSCLDDLPDFDDVEAEDKAFRHALQFERFNTALHFLVTWPALELASKLIMDRADEIDGNDYELLGPAADVLDNRYPMAARLLHRGLIDFALEQARVKRYRHAARHLQECHSLSTRIADFGKFENHDAYFERLKRVHGKKTSFWNQVKGER